MFYRGYWRGTSYYENASPVQRENIDAIRKLERLSQVVRKRKKKSQPADFLVAAAKVSLRWTTTGIEARSVIEKNPRVAYDGRTRSVLEGGETGGRVADYRRLAAFRAGELLELHDIPMRMTAGGSLTILDVPEGNGKKEYIVVGQKDDGPIIHSLHLIPSSGLSEHVEAWLDPTIIVCDECVEEVRLIDRKGEAAYYPRFTFEEGKKTGWVNKIVEETFRERLKLGQECNNEEDRNPFPCVAEIVTLGTDQLILQRGDERKEWEGLLVLDSVFGALDLMASVRIELPVPLDELQVLDGEAITRNDESVLLNRRVFVFEPHQLAKLFSGKESIARAMFGNDETGKYIDGKPVKISACPWINPPLRDTAPALLGSRYGLTVEPFPLREAKDLSFDELQNVGSSHSATIYNGLDSLGSHQQSLGKLASPLTGDQVNKLNEIGEEARNINCFSAAIAAYRCLRKYGNSHIRRKAKQTLSKLKTIIELLPRPSLQIMKEIIETLLGILEDLEDLEQFTENLNREVQTYTVGQSLSEDNLNPKLKWLTEFEDKMGAYRNLLAANSIDKKGTPSLWYLSAEGIIDPSPDEAQDDEAQDDEAQDDEAQDDEHSIWSVVTSLRKRLASTPHPLDNDWIETVHHKSSQLLEGAQKLNEDFPHNETLWDVAEAEYQRSDSDSELVFEVVSSPGAEAPQKDWMLPKAGELFHVLFKDATDKNAQNVFLRVSEKGEGHERWLLVQFWDDGEGLTSSDWEAIEGKKLSDVNQGEGLEWVIRVVKELGGEVIVRSQCENVCLNDHAYGPGTQVSKQVIPDLIKDWQDDETGCELTLAFPLFRN